MFKKGDLVSRNSHNNDVIFKIEKIEDEDISDDEFFDDFFFDE